MKVLNKKRDKIPEGSVYIGRPGPFGNPFVIGKDGDRGNVITKFTKHFMDRIAGDQEFRLKVHGLSGAPALVCWCAPAACHGDVIAEYLSKNGL